ncbi:MAG: hypothetical protein ACHQRM_15475 [Bacteroidia bacterium]
MRTPALLILILYVSATAFAQQLPLESARTRRVGFMGSLDYAYNFQDKILTPGLGRKWTFGLSYTNKKRTFVGFIAAGIKGFKFNLCTPTFRQSFVQDVKNNFKPIKGLSEDSLIAAKIGGSNGPGLFGTYSQFVQIGIVLNKRMKPSCSFYYGNEEFLMFDHAFTQFEDPKYGDIDYVGMSTTFYELKLGCTLPFKRYASDPFCLNLNIGYKWVDYGSLAFNKTPLNAYTSGALDRKYNADGKITISISFTMWSNWK